MAEAGGNRPIVFSLVVPGPSRRLRTYHPPPPRLIKNVLKSFRATCRLACAWVRGDSAVSQKCVHVYVFMLDQLRHLP